jgi:hypothetical protein
MNAHRQAGPGGVSRRDALRLSGMTLGGLAFENAIGRPVSALSWTTDSRTADFSAGLDAAGFHVQESWAEVVDPFQVCGDWRFMDSCAGNNIGQPYKRWVVLPPPGRNLPADIPFVLAPDEAVVYVGRTPPPCDYFSFVPMLWSRHYPDSCKLTGDFLFASVTDPLNNALIRTESTETPFGQSTLVVLTADEGVYERVKQAAMSAGFPESMINPLVLPSSILQLGIGPGSDRFMVLMRTANFVSHAEGRKYLADNQWGTIFRVTPRVGGTLQPFAQPPWRSRAWKHEETLVPGLTAGLERLEAAILGDTRHVQARPLGSMRWFYDSSEVLDPAKAAYRKYVAGESSDTPYRRSAEYDAPANFLLGEDDMVVAYGVNHAATGIATYSMFGVYGDWTLSHCPPRQGEPVFVYGANDPVWNGVAGVNSHAFAGSAEKYIPGDPMAPYLYAIRVVRERRVARGDKHCLVVPGSRVKRDSKYGPPFYLDVIGLDKPAFIGYRAYLNPATSSGPAYEDVIPDRAIWFRLE